MITEEQERLLADLRIKIADNPSVCINGKRLAHTYSVEREITGLAQLFAPQDEYLLRAAALLHDITKQLPTEKQLQLCDEFGILYTPLDRLMPKTFHARTAVEVIKRDFPLYAVDTVLGAIQRHTTGRADMTMGEKLLYLADYIEATRTFDDCVTLRAYFYSHLEAASGESSRNAVLRDTLILSFDMTIQGLIDDAIPIHRDTFEARNYLIEEKELENK